MAAAGAACAQDKLPRSQALVLVTRPARDAAEWVERLQQAGFNALALPLIEIAGVSAPEHRQALAAAWQTLDSYAACMFVSGNAVEHFFKSNQALARVVPTLLAIDSVANKNLQPTYRALPAALRMMAPGPGTAAALLAAGARASQIDSPAADAAQFDSEALWQLVGARDWQGKRVLLVRGLSEGLGAGVSSGRDWLSQRLKEAGAAVDVVSVYERRAPVLTGPQLQQAQKSASDGSVWLFSSSEALANLIAMPGLQAVDWSGARAVATHPRIEAAVLAAGWGVVSGSRPALADIVAKLASIESTIHERQQRISSALPGV